MDAFTIHHPQNHNPKPQQTRQYAPGCVAYSLAVSVKMNVLLFAPALALVLVQALGAFL